MLNTAQRLFNYITQNEKDGRSKPDLITRRQARRIKKKARRGEPHTVVVEIEDFVPESRPDVQDALESVDTTEAWLASYEPPTETSGDFGPVTVPDDPEVDFATGGVVHDDTEQLTDMTVAQLKALSKARELKGYSAMKKAELISLLRDE